MSAVPSIDTGAVAAKESRGRFLGSKRAYWRILSRDGLALIASLGLYRFWVSTDVRRYLWSHTEIAGEQLDYTGDPLELLVGFLVLLVVLAPFVALFSILSLTSGSLALAIAAAYAPVVILLPLAVVALYQARRYRVNHTVYRGIRFHQTGSAWIYALLTALWFLINLVTFALTYPLARRSLERYKLRHTYYGDLAGTFDGNAFALFKRGLLLWLIVIAPFAATILLPATGPASSDELGEILPQWVAMLLALLVGLVVYPIFRAMVLRWRVSGMRFGTLTFASDFSTWTVCKAYFKFYGLLLLLGILFGIGTLIVQLVIVPAMPIGQSIAIEFIGVVALVIAYFAVVTAAAFAYQGTVRFDIWRAIVDSLVIRGIDQIDRVRLHAGHEARHAGRIGAALNLGGF